MLILAALISRFTLGTITINLYFKNTCEYVNSNGLLMRYAYTVLEAILKLKFYIVWAAIVNNHSLTSKELVYWWRLISYVIRIINRKYYLVPGTFINASSMCEFVVILLLLFLLRIMSGYILRAVLHVCGSCLFIIDTQLSPYLVNAREFYCRRSFLYSLNIRQNHLANYIELEIYMQIRVDCWKWWKE